MKKNYLNPVLLVLNVSEEDILTLSKGTHSEKDEAEVSWDKL